MNILHIATARSWRGGEQQLAYLLGELAKYPVKQEVVCTKASKMQHYCQMHDIPQAGCSKRGAFDIRFSRFIRKISKRFKPDIIHVHDAHAHTLALLSTILFGNKAPLVVSRRVDFPIQANGFSRYKYNHQQIKKIISVSKAVQKIVEPAIVDKERLITIYDGIDIGRFSGGAKGILRDTFGIPEEHCLIGNVAAIAPHKDYYTFVDTAEILIRQNIAAAFFIIGDGPERKDIERYIAEKQLEKYIIMTGFRDDIPLVLPELDIFLMTSATEGLGTSVLDAFAAQVAVVATAAGGIPEIVISEKTGLLGAVKDPPELARLVLKLLQDPQLKKELVGNAFEKLKYFTREATAAATWEVYQHIQKDRLSTSK